MCVMSTVSFLSIVCLYCSFTPSDKVEMKVSLSVVTKDMSFSLFVVTKDMTVSLTLLRHKGYDRQKDRV